MEETLHDIPRAWSLVFLLLSGIFVFFCIWHLKKMPEAPRDQAMPGVTPKTILSDFCLTFVTFFKKKYVLSALAFMLFYRLPEALCIKLVQPFFIASRESGGLALSTSQVGFINGTVGVIALLFGGIIGGLAISRNGLKSWLWPMALSLTLPCFFYCLLAMLQPDNFYFISAAIFIEQFGYGFGFTAYMLYLIYFSRGESQTSHYAFCTAFMALGMMIPGMFAGWLHDLFMKFNIFGADGPQGFINFFWLVMISCIATFMVCLKVKIAPEFGKKNPDKNN